MSNIHFAVLAPPDKHEDIIKNINKWKYDIEGKVAKGKQAPFIAEIRFYEVRIPDEIKGEFIRDTGLANWGANSFGVSNSWRTKLFWYIYKFMLKFTPYKPLKAASGEKKYSHGMGWAYFFPVGEIKRKPVKVKGGKAREVL